MFKEAPGAWLVQNSKYALVEQTECMRKRNNAAKHGVSSGSALFAKINTLLVMVDY